MIATPYPRHARAKTRASRGSWPKREPYLWVYILANGRNGTLYIGVTSNIAARIYQHKEGLVRGFTKRYGATKLVHCEAFDSISYAIQREKNLKKWPRKWKLDLIERDNPQWRDLAEEALW